MSEKFKAGQQIAITPQLQDQFRKERQSFNSAYQTGLQEFDASPDLEYYILSTKFINAWKDMISRILEDGSPTVQKVVTLPQPYNHELIQNQDLSFGQVEIKMNTQQGIDYQFVNNETMSIFSRYQGKIISRRAYFYGVQKMVERFPIKFKYSFISQSWLKQLRQKSPDSSLVLHHGLAYKNQSVLDLLYRMIQYSKQDPRNRANQYINKTSAKIYVGRFSESLQEYSKTLKQKIQNSNLKYVSVDPPGEELRKDMIIGDLVIPQQGMPIMMIQLQQESFVYRPTLDVESDKHDFCEYCRKRKQLIFVCKCKEVHYCSKQCQQRDQKYHFKSCQALMEEDNLEPEFNILENSKRGVVGLQNLGNTCYMNSALQCLIHTKLLTEYFQKKLYIPEINAQNPIGSKGKIVKSYAKFIQSVLVSTQDVVAPHKLKYAIGKAKQMFNGYQQHDSQEFLLFLLDILHEDLNRVRQKPYTSSVENHDRPDYQVAKESWLTYLKRNQSYINDLMGGQYRSQVKCPDCQNISVTFDPFLIFSVPIPSANEGKTINLYVFFSDYKKQTLKMTVSSKNNIVKQLRDDVVQKTETSLEQMKFFILGFNGGIRKVSDDETVDKLINEKQFNESGEQRQLFGLQIAPQQLVYYEEPKNMLIFKLKTKQNKTLTFKRPFFFDIGSNKITGRHLYQRICKFLFPVQRKFHHSYQQLSEKELKNKYQVFLEKTLQEQKFKIVMAHGVPSEATNNIIYPQFTQIKQETNISELIKLHNYGVEFQVVFPYDPSYQFNSFKPFGASYSFHDYSSYGEKSGFNESFTLQECLEQMKLSEKLIEGNQVFCQFCHDFKLSEKKMELFKASKYLVIQLRRFKQVGYQKSKNQAEIKYPEYLNLQNYALNHQLPEAYFLDDLPETQKGFYFPPEYHKTINAGKSTQYRLYSVVNHSGSLNGGHYTAYRKCQDQWYQFDDSYVRKLSEHNWRSGSSAYLLFYERIENEEQKKQ